MFDLTQKIHDLAGRNTLAPAIFGPDSYISYHELDHVIAVISNFLFDRQIRTGSKVALNIADPDIHLLTGIAAMHCGLVPFMTANIITAVKSGTVDLVISAGEPQDRAISPDIMIDETVLAGPMADPVLRTAADRDPGQPALIGSTTGTTGIPSLIGEPCTASVFKSRAKTLDIKPDDRIMITLAPTSALARTLTFSALYHGAAIVRQPADLDDAIGAINLFGVDTIQTTPDWIRRISERMKQTSAACPSVSRIRLAGSLFPATLIEKIRSQFNATLLVAYGATEVGEIAHGALPAGTYREGYVGKINDNIGIVTSGTPSNPGRIGVKTSELRHLYDQGLFAVPDGEIYWMPDSGYTDGENLYLSGRIDEVFNFSGVKIAFSTIAARLNEVLEISEVAFFPRDPQDLVLFIPGKAHLNEESIADCVSELVGLTSVRDHIQIQRVREIPRNAAGKIDRAALRDLIVQ